MKYNPWCAIVRGLSVDGVLSFEKRLSNGDACFKTVVDLLNSGVKIFAINKTTFTQTDGHWSTL
jgi:hypothetical protein